MKDALVSVSISKLLYSKSLSFTISPASYIKAVSILVNPCTLSGSFRKFANIDASTCFFFAFALVNTLVKHACVLVVGILRLYHSKTEHKAFFKCTHCITTLLVIVYHTESMQNIIKKVTIY